MGTNETRDETTKSRKSKVCASLNSRSRSRSEEEGSKERSASTISTMASRKNDHSLKRSRISWRVHLHICKEYVKKYHHGLVPHKYSVKGLQTGRYVSNQRSYFKKKGMDKIHGRDLERIKAFDTIGVNLRPKETAEARKSDESFDETFMENFAALCSWRNNNGGFAGVPRSLKSFCTEVRERHQNKGLSEDHINCLASIHFPWTEFDAGFKQLLKFKQVEKHFDVPEDHVCFSWTKEIRRMYREKELPDMSYQILHATGFQFENLPCPRSLNQSAHVKFITENERPVSDRRMRDESQGQRSSSSRRSGTNKSSKAPMVSHARSDDDHDDSDGSCNPSTHVKFPASNERPVVDRRMQDESQGQRSSSSRRSGTNKSSKAPMVSHVRSDNDNDDSDGSVNPSTHVNFPASNEHPRADGRMRGESQGQRSSSSCRSANKLNGPRNDLSDDDSDDNIDIRYDRDSGNYFHSHRDSDIDSDNSNIDSGSTRYKIDSGGSTGGRNSAKEDEDLENSPFRSNKTLSDKGGSMSEKAGSITDCDGGDEGATADKGDDEANSSGSKNEKQVEDGNKTSSNGGDEEPAENINMRSVKLMKKDQLVQECKGYGLDSTGTKATLSLRLYQFYRASPKYNPQNW